MKSTPHITRKINSCECISQQEYKILKCIELWSSRPTSIKTEILFVQMNAPSPLDGLGTSGDAPTNTNAHQSPTGPSTSDSSNVDQDSVAGGSVGGATSHLEKMGSTMTSNVEGVEKAITVAQQVKLPKTLSNSANDATLPSIKFYLRKPIKVTSGVLQSTDAASTFTKYGVFDVLKTNSLYYNKLVGSFAFRADTVVTLQVNANRFQAGRYMLCYLPTGGAPLTDPATVDMVTMKTFSATQVTQLPHVELDLSTDTQVTIRIPYSTFANSTPVAKNSVGFTNFQPGYFFIYPYMALLPGSSATTAGYVLWVHYENVELFGNMAPQMASFDAGRGTSATILNKGKEAIGLEVKNPGPVETMSNKVRGAANAVSSVPLLSAFAGPVSWLADIVGGVCSVFGWSKPITIDPIRNCRLEMFNTIGNCDTHDAVTSLGLIENNHVHVLPGSSTVDSDELSINYLKSIYSYYKVYNFAATNNIGDNIFTIPLCPSTFYNTPVDSGSYIVSATPIAWLSTFFSLYRGGIKFRVKIVKTEFHSGRLIFGFFPVDSNIDPNSTAVSFANLDYVQKTVVDIRENNEFELEVPFLSTTSYKNLGASGNAGTATQLGLPEPYGFLACYVMSNLVAPDGVTSTIKLLVEVAGASDLEFECPRTQVFQPIVPLAVTAAPQMADFTGDVSLGLIGTTAHKDMEYNDAACCIGEGITSLRQLLKRPEVFFTYSGNKKMYLQPQAITPLINVATTGPVMTNTSPDLFTMLGTCFAYYRGGIRMKVLPATMSTVNQSLVQVTLLKILGTTAGSGYRTNISTDSSATALNVNTKAGLLRGCNFSCQRFDWGLGIAIPFYSNTHAKPTVMSYAGNSSSTRYAWSPNYMSQMDLTVQFNVDTADLLNGTYLRYGADDLNFGLFTGVPPLFQVAL